MRNEFVSMYFILGAGLGLSLLALSDHPRTYIFGIRQNSADTLKDYAIENEILGKTSSYNFGFDLSPQ